MGRGDAGWGCDRLAWILENLSLDFDNSVCCCGFCLDAVSSAWILVFSSDLDNLVLVLVVSVGMFIIWHGC